MNAEQVVNAAGPVQIGSLTFMVQELSVQAEVGLLRQLRVMARKALGPGSFYASALPTLEWMKTAGYHGDRQHLMEIVGRLIATGGNVSDDVLDEYRRSPDGVAEELFWRTRKTHPDAARDELRVLVNEVNALEVHLAILEAIAPKNALGGDTTPSN
jgi:hypothetical protein